MTHKDNSPLTLEMLDKALALIEGEKNVIMGFVVSPSDYHSIKEKAKMLWAVDDIKGVVMPPYKGLELYVSDMVENGKPIPLIKKLKGINPLKEYLNAFTSRQEKKRDCK